jgi:hypothetical protein
MISNLEYIGTVQQKPFSIINLGNLLNFLKLFVRGISGISRIIVCLLLKRWHREAPLQYRCSSCCAFKYLFGK